MNVYRIIFRGRSASCRLPKVFDGEVQVEARDELTALRTWRASMPDYVFDPASQPVVELVRGRLGKRRNRG